MAKRTTGVYIVPDDAEVVRVSEIVKKIDDGQSQRQIAQELGVSTATVNRQLSMAGYEVQTTVRLVRRDAPQPNGGKKKRA